MVKMELRLILAFAAIIGGVVAVVTGSSSDGKAELEILRQTSDFLRARTPDEQWDEVVDVLQHHNRYDHEQSEQAQAVIRALRALGGVPRSVEECAEFGHKMAELRRLIEPLLSAAASEPELSGLKAVRVYKGALSFYETFC